MPEQPAEFTLSDLAALAAERRRRFVSKDAVISEILSRPLHSGGDVAPLVADHKNAAVLREGARLDLAGGLRHAFGEGWHPPDGEWGVWSSALRAELLLDIEPGVHLPAYVHLELACIIPAKGDQRLSVSSPARLLVELELRENADPLGVELFIEAQDLSDRRLHLFIDLDGLLFAGSLPGSQDNRWLGMALKSVSLSA
jgi:hypothetical protein